LVWLWPLLVAAAPAAAPAAADAGYDDTWARSLGPSGVVHLPAGTYAGPWHLGPGVHLQAEAGAVLEARQSGTPALVVEGAGVTLEGLTVRAAAGAIGIEANGCAKLTLGDVHVIGGSRGLAVRGGDVSWTGGSVEGTRDYGIWAKEAHLSLRGLRLTGHHGPALYVLETQAEVFQCELDASEYGILGFRSQLDVSESGFTRDRRAGLGLSRSSGSLARNHLSGPFIDAAISLLAARDLRIEGNRISQAGSMGIKLTNSTARLAGNVVAGARSDTGGLEGDGLFFYASQILSHGDVLRGNGGTGVTVLGGAATLLDCRIEETGQAAAYVANHGSLVLSRCDVKGGSTQLIVEEDSTARTDGTRFETPPDGGPAP
jgi:nitrous oxidase accessory protein NosD